MTAFTWNEDKKKDALELGAHHAINSRNPEEIESYRFDQVNEALGTAAER